MEAWKKSSEALTQRFNALLPTHPDAVPRKMFGYAACFVKGNFWIGLFRESVVVRLPGGLEQGFPALAGSPAFDPMGGRPMRGMFVVPADIVASDKKLGKLMADTFTTVLTLPAKAPKKKAAPKNAAPKSAAAKKAAPKKAAPRNSKSAAKR